MSGVYFLRREDGLVKIGCSADINARREVLRRKYGALELLALIEVEHYYYIEAIFHRLYSNRYSIGEWFDLYGSDIMFARDLQGLKEDELPELICREKLLIDPDCQSDALAWLAFPESDMEIRSVEYLKYRGTPEFMARVKKAKERNA